MQRILVLHGGTSTERDVSLKSGAAIAEGLREIGHDVTLHDLQADTLEGVPLDDYTFVFNGLHGGKGEDGTIQREVEKAGIPYSGSGPIACRLAMDKELTKAQFLAARIPTAPYTVVDASDGRSRLRRAANRLGFPMVVKPVAEGSSVGVSLVRSIDELEASLADAFQYGKRVMLEQYIEGREFTVAIIGARAYPLVEIVSQRAFFDYEAKYSDEGTHYITEPEVNDLQTKLASYYAKRAFNALRCHGYGRIDLMLNAEGEFQVLEANTLPGMTSRSLLPLSASRAGLGYEEALQAMIDASLVERRAIALTEDEALAPLRAA